MVDDKFGKPDDERPGDPSEGVRIIGAEEAAEALERGDIASRRGGDEPRYGDRPKPPPVGPRPALRFPLGSSGDPADIEKPAPLPGGIEFEPLGGGQRFDPIPPGGEVDDAPTAAVDEPTEAAPSLFARGADAEAEVPPLVEPLLDADEDDVQAAVSDEPVSVPVEMPHWSDPATGEVPKVIVGDDAGDDLDAWSSFAASSPRWRDSDRDWERDSGMHEVLAGGDEDWRVGAMDDARPTQDEIYSFEDIEPDADLEPVLDREPDLEFAPYDDVEGEDEVEAAPVVVGGRGGNPRRRTPPERRNPVADYAGGGGGMPAPGGGRDIGTAVLVGVGLAALFLFLSKMGSAAVMCMVVPALAIAAVEFFNAVRRAGYQPAVLFGLVASVAFPLAVYWKGMGAYPVLLALTVMAAMAWHLAGADGDARAVESIGVTLFGVAWIGGLGSFAALMLSTPGGVILLQIAVLATVGYDAGGFFIGRSAGSRPLSEASPNKTVEGLVGGMVTAVVLALFYGLIISPSPYDSVGACALLGIGAALVAPLGDLCESMVKRDLGIKDMGSILPAHGGLLDRFDAMLFVLPTVFFVAFYFGLGPFPG